MVYKLLFSLSIAILLLVTCNKRESKSKYAIKSSISIAINHTKINTSQTTVPSIPSKLLVHKIDNSQTKIKNKKLDSAKFITISGRPFQFILLSFDGSKSPKMWKETLDFAKNNQLSFTYFISAVYFLPDYLKSKYVAPGYGVPASNIGFGGTQKDVIERSKWLLKAFLSGNDIASHGNGHFFGKKWDFSQWKSEFLQFKNILMGVIELDENNIIDKKSWISMVTSIKGFRAPNLSNGYNMFKALSHLKYSYDASTINNRGHWAKRRFKNLWIIPFGYFHFHHKSTIAMDYNFYYLFGQGHKTSAQCHKISTEIFEVYKHYFNNNYYGKRAAIVIGNHFSKWHKAAYWKTMKKFAKTYCNKPEVICTTYSKYVKFLESLSSSQLKNFSRGNFPRKKLNQTL